MKIELIDVSKSFINPNGSIEVFKNLNMTVMPGEFVSILGPNGCGKTTLFNMIMGLDNEFAGEIRLDHIEDKKEAIAYMMQKDLLLPWKTVYENIIIGLEIQGKVNSTTKDYVCYYLRLFGISNLLDRYPSILSGGERQKVALIRTLILESKIMLFDEPFSAIDYNTRLELQTQIRSIAKTSFKTVLLITHDIDEAIMVSDRVIILNQKPNGIFKIIVITFKDESRSLIGVKEDHKFTSYFVDIWKSLPKQKEE